MADEDFSEGFLSPGIIAVADLIRDRYAPWIAAFARVNRYGVGLQHSIQVDGGDRQQVLAACLFARTLSNAQAACILLGRGMEAQSRAMLRTTLESLFALAAVVTDPELSDRFAFAHHIERRRMIFRARAWTSPELKECATAAATDEKLKEIEARISATEAQKISAEDLAKAAGLHEWYLTAYGLLSWAVHNTAGDLERHVVYADDGSVQEFRNEAEIENLESLWLMATEILLKAIGSLPSVFAVQPNEFIEAEYAQLRALVTATEG